MIRIFSFIGSMAGEKSSTARYSDELARVVSEMAKKQGEEVSYERMTGKDVRVDYCLSCSSCFRNGVCPLDSRDDMAMLKKKMSECDILFVGSPVYIGDMSGLMKSVMDRISYWAHRYELAGKPAAVFAVTDSSHGQETAERMSDALNYTGLLTVHTGYARRGMHTHPNLYLETDMGPIWQEAAEKLLCALRSPASFVTELDELKFRTRKALAKRALKYAEVTGIAAWDECVILQERGVTGAKTYAEYLKGLEDLLQATGCKQKGDD